MTRFTLAAVAAMAGLAVIVDTADAKTKRRNDDRQQAAADKIRADSLDPTRELKYPDWARKALAPKGGGGTRG